MANRTNNRVISDRTEGYKNDTLGINRMAQEKMLDNKGRKIIKETDRNGNT